MIIIYISLIIVNMCKSIATHYPTKSKIDILITKNVDLGYNVALQYTFSSPYSNA